MMDILALGGSLAVTYSLFALLCLFRCEVLTQESSPLYFEVVEYQVIPFINEFFIIVCKKHAADIAFFLIKVAIRSEHVRR